MKISENWLREWVNPNLDTDALVEQLTIAGLEVDGVAPAAGIFTDVVVADVISVEPHPDADKLRICQVNFGGDASAQVVCGAANVYAGMKAPLAKVGASLPGGMKIKKAKLRGIESFGMLCSEQELGMAASADGLMELPGDADIGQSIGDYLGLDDMLVEIDLTPNRGDCLSIRGIAREVAALNRLSINRPDYDLVQPTIDETFRIVLDSPQDCPAYTGRIIKGINPAAATPLWMVEKLRRSDVRSISAVVDITNYVLLELGQPMHAFDLSKLAGSIHVRRAKDDESLTLLDGKEITLDDDVLVIADEQQTLAMAGIMGGEASSVSDQTTDIFLEAAYFSPVAIAGRARRFGLHTDSSHRFERGVDPALQAEAIDRATQLIIDICGGAAGPVTTVREDEALPEIRSIMLRKERIQHMLGIDIPDDQIEDHLVRLNIKYSGGQGSWQVEPPGYRFDLGIEADLVEEIARLYGYNNIPHTLPVVPQTMLARPEYELGIDLYKDILAQRGWQEAITYSFVDPVLQEKLGFDRNTVQLSNPISSEMSVMRTSHWPGLIAALQHNQNRQQKQVRLFETGLIFAGMDDRGDQKSCVSGIAAGDYWPEQWSVRQRKIDFYDVKGDLESLLVHTRNSGVFSFIPAEHPALHPGQSARIMKNEQAVGWLGVMHPEIEKELSLDGPVVLFEIESAAIIQAQPLQFQPISKYPSIRRDLSFLVAEQVSSDEILQVIEELPLKTISKKWVFDVYQGEGVEIGLKSMSLGLILLDSSRTLTDEDVEEIVSQVIDILGEKLNASLRD